MTDYAQQHTKKMDMTVKEEVAEIRRIIKARIPQVRVLRGQGTSSGWVDVWAHDLGGSFTDAEYQMLRTFKGISVGGNSALVSSDNRRYFIENN